MNPKLFWLLTAILLVSVHRADAQQQRIFRIGYLASARSAPTEFFVQGLRDLGYVDGKNIVIELRTTKGESGRLPELAAELVRLNVDIIVADTAGEARAAKKATATIPIVMRGVADPVGLHLVSSLARPGGNITGIDTLSPGLSGKRLEVLKEAIPKISRVAFLTPEAAAFRTSIKETENAAQVLRLQLYVLKVQNVDDLETALKAVKNQRADALVEAQATSLAPLRPRIIEFAVKNRLPVMYSSRRSVELGGLMSYGNDPVDQNRRAAAMIDKILKGRKPAEIPVERTTKFELVINLKTGKQIGLTIPPNALARADRVIR
jgi:ABC-type uncharacterized transport system substrate-binding protein